jgi:hypothetical protein
MNSEQQRRPPTTCINHSAGLPLILTLSEPAIGILGLKSVRIFKAREGMYRKR